MLWFVEHFFCGSRCCDIKVCGFYGSSTGLQRGDSFLWRIYGLLLRIYESYLLRFGSRLQCGVEVLGGSLLNILKGRYLLKRRKVIITSLTVVAELFYEVLEVLEEELSTKEL